MLPTLEAIVLLLAQTCAAEIGLQPEPDECVVMWEINARAAERKKVTVAEQTLAFNAYWDPRVAHTSRRWIGELRADGVEPEHWPTNLRWPGHAPRWQRYVERSRQFVVESVRGLHKPVCAAADDYGGDPDDEAGAEDPAPCVGAERVACVPGQRQAYWITALCRRRGRPAIASAP